MISKYKKNVDINNKNTYKNIIYQSKIIKKNEIEKYNFSDFEKGNTKIQFNIFVYDFEEKKFLYSYFLKKANLIIE